MAFFDIVDITPDGKTPVVNKVVSTSDGFKLAVIDGITTRIRAEDYVKVMLNKADLTPYAEIVNTIQRGYVKKSTVDALPKQSKAIEQNFAGLEAEIIPTRLMDQLFRIVEVVENEDYVEVTARHVWYDNLKNYTLWEADKDTEYTGAQVCRNIISNALSPVNSSVNSDCTDTIIGEELDFQNKNIVEAFLDPESGVCAQFGLSLIRYNWDFYCLKNVGYDRGFVIENGKNLLGVERTESIENLATRVAPIGKTKKGDIVWLDYNGQKYIDSPHIADYSVPHVELYDTGLQIGSGGVTAQNIQAKLLEAAQKRFNEDHVDIPEVEMTIEFISLGDTEEYAQYRGLDKVYLYDILTIKDTIRGYSYTAQVVGVEHDILTGMLNSVTIGKLQNWDGTRKIATWQVPEVNGENIRLLSIQAGAFAPGAIGSDDLMEGIITAGKIDVTDLNAINATLGTATIAQAIVESADISFAQIKALTAENLIAHDAVTDRYYIRKLAVDNAQMVYATVGELVVKASNNKYYRLDIDADGQLTPTEVTLTQGEITAGITSDGRASIIETDLTVTDLSASNMKGISALIDKITASRIDVQELFARQATITQLNTVDISGNNSLQLYVGTNAYTKKSGIEITDNGVEIEGGKWVKIKAGSGQTLPGKLIVESGNFTVDASGNVTMTGTVNAAAGSVIGGWTLGANDLHAGSGSTYVAMASSGDYAFYAGSGTAADAPFRVKRDGTVTLTKLMTIGSGGAEQEVNLRTAGLWKLSSVNVKDASFNSTTNTLTLTRFSGGDVVVNFSGAGSANLEGSWVGNVYTVTETLSGADLSETFTCTVNVGTTTGAYQNYVINTFDSFHKAFAQFTSLARTSAIYSVNVDASGVYTAGWNDAKPTSISLGSIIAGMTYTIQVGQGGGAHTDMGLDLSTVYTDGQDSVNVTHGSWSTVSPGQSGYGSITFSPSEGEGTGELLEIGLFKGSGEPTDGTQTIGAAARIGGSSWTYVKQMLLSMTASAWANNKSTITLKADATTQCTLEVDASSIYTNGWNAAKPTSVSLGSLIAGHTYTIQVGQGGGAHTDMGLDLSSVYTAGQNSVNVVRGAWDTSGSRATMTLSPSAGTGSTTQVAIALAYVKTDDVSGVLQTRDYGTGSQQNLKNYEYTLTAGSSWSSHKKSVSFNLSSVAIATIAVDATSEYNAGVTAGDASGKTTGWNLAVGKVVMPSASTNASMSVTTPGSTYNTSGATTYYLTLDNNYAYIRVGSTSGTVVSRRSNTAYANGQDSVTISAGGWVGGSNVVSASNGKTVTVNLPTISLTGGTTWSNHKTTVYASGGGSSGAVASKEVDATSEYNAGWNACLDACGFGSYTKFYVGGSYARYAYSAPTSSATRYDYCRYGAEMATGHDVPARK